MEPYEIRVSSMDLYAANVIAGQKANEEGMLRTAERHEALALHIQNASKHMQDHTPEGYRVETVITFKYVPNINPVLRPEFQ